MPNELRGSTGTDRHRSSLSRTESLRTPSGWQSVRETHTSRLAGIMDRSSLNDLVERASISLPDISFEDTLSTLSSQSDDFSRQLVRDLMMHRGAASPSFLPPFQEPQTSRRRPGLPSLVSSSRRPRTASVDSDTLPNTAEASFLLDAIQAHLEKFDSSLLPSPRDDSMKLICDNLHSHSAVSSPNKAISASSSSSSPHSALSTKQSLIAKHRVTRVCSSKYHRLIAQGWTSQNAFHLIASNLSRNPPATSSSMITTSSSSSDIDVPMSFKHVADHEVSQVDETELQMVMERTGFSRSISLDVLSIRRFATVTCMILICF
jgi:hypothetical protein